MEDVTGGSPAELKSSAAQSQLAPQPAQSRPAQSQPASQPAPAPRPQPAPLSAGRVRACVALLVALGFVLGCSEFIVIGMEVEIAADLGISVARVGELVSVFALFYAVLTPVLALVTGRFRRFTLLVVYAAVFCAGNLLAMLAPTFEALLASRALLGSVAGALLALGVTYIPDLLGSERVSKTISVIYAAFAVALVVSTSLGKLVADALDWHVGMVGVFAVGALLCGTLVAVLPRTGATDEPATVREQAVLLGQPCVWAGMLVFVFGIGSVYVLYAYITPYLESVLGLSAAASSAVLMGYGAVCFVSNLLSGWLDARFGLKALLVVFPLQALVLAGIYLATPDVPATLTFVFALALTMCTVSVPVISMFMHTANTRCPKALTLASSLEPMSYNVGIAFGTAVGGWVASGPGMQDAGLVGAVLSLAALGAVVATMALRRRGR